MHRRVDHLSGFHPAPWLRNPHVQSFLSSSFVRKLGTHGLVNPAREILVSGGGGVRLAGFHTPAYRRPAKGLVILLHGWEGSSASAYVLAAGRYFLARGLDVFRLNLRDHGPSHHLNRGLFHGMRIAETHAAIRDIAARFRHLPCYLIGFSIGGNFALRIALRHQPEDAPNLRHVFAVSPPLDPYKATLAIDNGLALYRRYFVKKWKRSLEKKQALFPGVYDFGDVLKLNTCLAMTEAIMPYFPEYQNVRDYFADYTLKGDIFGSLEVPLSIIAAQDDPIIPARDYRTLGPRNRFQLFMPPHGGHCGFFEAFPHESWHEHLIAQILGV